MSIRRAKFGIEGQFTQIPNSWARNKNLSLKARGLLLELMSHQEGWETSIAKLCSDHDGEAAVKSAIQELKNARMLQRQRNYTSGVLVWDWVLGDNLPPDNIPVENIGVCNIPVSNRPPKNTKLKEDQPEEDDLKETPLSPPRGRAKTPPHHLPEDWAPNASHKRKADTLGVDVDELSKRMRQWAFANDIRRANWNNTFNQFLARAKPSPSSKIGGLAEFDRLVAADDKPAVEALLGERCREPADFVELDVSVRAERFKAYFREWAAARRHKLSS